jgi:hypothetical protein
MVAECVAIKSRLTEIVQTVEILRCELVVSELVVAQLIVAQLIVTQPIVTEIMTAAAHGVTSKSACVSPATMGSNSMVPTASAMPATTTVNPSKPTASAMPATTAATAVITTASTASTAPTTTPTAMPGERRDVCHDAKRTHRDARCQNGYCSLIHGTYFVPLGVPIWR